ncbi:MAG: hypothetical protein ACR2IS_02630 [Nitrososphaeraceae archaeon]
MTTTIEKLAGDYTSIRISRKTLDKLGKLRHFKDTWDTIIEGLASERLGLEVSREKRSF